MSVSTKNPRIILGLMTYGPDSSKDSRVTSLPEFQRHLERFQSYGYNEIDTARIYAHGQQEKFTAEGWMETPWSTSCYEVISLVPGGHTPSNLRADLEKSLSELGAEQVEIFYLHKPDRSVPIMETLEAVNELYPRRQVQEARGEAITRPMRLQKLP